MLERRPAPGGGTALVYEGHVLTPEAEFPLKATVDAAGEVAVETSADEALAEKARLLVRTAVRHAAADEEPPPRVIQRWRGEK